MTGKKSLFDELQEFAQKEGEAGRKESEGAEGSPERSGGQPSDADREAFWNRFKPMWDELVYIKQAVAPGDENWQAGHIEVLLAILQVPDLRDELAEWLGRPASLIVEGPAIRRLRQKLLEAVTLKPPGNQDKSDWYTFWTEVAEKSKDKKQYQPGYIGEITEALRQWQNGGGFNAFLSAFIDSGKRISDSFLVWLKTNRQRLDYRSFRRDASQLRLALKSRVKGQTAAVEGVADAYAQSILRKSSGPRSIFTLMGPPGTGKTLLAESFAEVLPDIVGENYQVLRFSMEQFNDWNANKTLFGVGQFYTEASLGQLTDPVLNNPKSVIIFDEIEKASPEVIQSLLGVLDRGAARDETSLKTADFSQSFVFFTTNLGQSVLKQRKESGQELGTLDQRSVSGILEAGEDNPQGLSPEFISRLSKGKFLVFEELPQESLLEIYTSAWNELNEETQIEVSVPRCGYSLAALQLLSRIPDLSARGADTAPEQDIVEFLDQLLEQADAQRQSGSMQRLAYRIERVGSTLESLMDDEEISAPLDMFIIDDDARAADLLETKVPNLSLARVSEWHDLAEHAPERVPELILIDLFIHADQQNGTGTPALQQLLDIRKRFPEVPVLVFAIDGRQTDQGKRALNTAHNFEGVKDIRTLDSTDPSEFIEWVNGYVERLRYARLLKAFNRKQKRLRFSWACHVEGEKNLVMSPDLVHVEPVIQKEHIGGVAGLGAIPDERLSDVVGNERAVNTIHRAVGWLDRPRDIGKFGITPPRGYLLEGPPGTGKTFLAKAVAGECGIPFFSVNGADFVQTYYGEGGRLVRELFANARQYAPSIVFIDEIDAFAMSRDNGQRPDVSAINALLSEMDGFNSRSHPVLMLAATNYRESLDAALLRSGRFDEVIVCDLPNKAARKEMIRRGFQRAGLGDADETIESLAMRTQGSSAADIDALIREAIYHAVSDDRSPTVQDIEEACSRVVYGAVRTDLKLAEEEKFATAVHEAGHAIATHVLMPGKHLDYLSIQPRSSSLGFVSYRDESDNARGQLSMTVTQLKEQVVVFLAGREAERLMLGEDAMSTGATDDLRRATGLARHAIEECGLDPEIGPIAMDSKSPLAAHYRIAVAERLESWLSEAESRCANLLKEHQDSLKVVADALFDEESLDGESFSKLVSSGVIAN